MCKHWFVARASKDMGYRQSEIQETDRQTDRQREGERRDRETLAKAESFLSVYVCVCG